MEEDLQLPAHSARARRRRDIRRDRHGFKALMAFRHCLPKGHSLRTGSYRVRGILYVRAVDVLVVVGEDGCADAELRVRTVRVGFGGDALAVEA